MFTAFTVVIAVLAVGVGLIGARLLLGRNWVGGWLRGTAGIAFALLAASMLFAAWDLQGYRRLLEEQPVAELRFAQLGPRQFAVELTEPAAVARQYELYGDLWQLDVRLLRWHPALLRFGITPAYRLERLSGRYHSVDDELTQRRSVIALDDSAAGPDPWQWLGEQAWLPLVDAYYGSGTFLPMRHGAHFAVTLTPSGLIARPLNEAARTAVQQWR